MIKKVLIAEDQQMANISVRKALEDFGVVPDPVYYCDDALSHIKSAVQSGWSYDLLITDLHFEPDHRIQRLNSGAALIMAARAVQPDLKVLVFSAESNPSIIRSLITEQQIDGYVRKARNDARELRLAVESISKNQSYFPRQWLQPQDQQNAHQFDSFEIAIIKLLAQGMRQKDIPAILRRQQIQPSGLSSIEKRLNYVREKLGCSSNEQLVAYCKDKQVI